MVKGVYNKSIEELLKDFEDLQITEIVKQVNMQSGNPTGIGSARSNQAPPNPFYEHGETSNSFQSRRIPSLKNKKKPSPLTSKRQTINEEFKPQKPFLQEPNKNVSNIGTKSSISTGKTGIGSAGGRSSAS